VGSDGQSETRIQRRIGVVVVHGVADAEQGKNLKTLVDNLCKQPDSIYADQFEEVHWRSEISSVSKIEIPLPVVMRRCSLGRGQEAMFAEVFWADTTRVHTNKTAALLAGFRIVFEAHYFIDALVQRAHDSKLAAGFARLLYLAAALIRGPIAGVNVALLTISAIYLYGQALLRLAETETFRLAYPNFRVISLHSMVYIVCLLLAFFSWWIYLNKRAIADLAAMEVALWSAVGTTVGALLVGLGMITGTPRLPQNASLYAEVIYFPLVPLWAAFCVVVIVAFVMCVILVARSSCARTKRSLWLALAIVILQSALWILFISVPSVPLLGLGKLTGLEIPRVMSVVYIFALNCLGIAVVLTVALGVAAARARSAGEASKAIKSDHSGQEGLRQTAAAMPRLIVNKYIVTLILAAATVNIALTLTGNDQGELIKDNIWVSLVIALVVTLTSFALYGVLDTANFVNVVHIARDLIDHQYQPEDSYISRLLPGHRRSGIQYPRRERLQSRLKLVVKYLEEQRCAELVLVAHSQGSIIVFEYLERLLVTNNVPRIRVVTFGSPLSYLYSYYFHGYKDVGRILHELHDRGVKWTNLYRINDPIGNCIKDTYGAIENIALPKGANGEGHTNYWAEAAVGKEIRNALREFERRAPE
jgi:hypothetical protein